MRPIIQSQSSECALACLAMIASAHGLLIGLTELRRRFPVSLKGANLAQLVAQAGELGFAPRPVRLDRDDLAKLQIPCILQWDRDHFVVLRKVGRRHVVIVDPAVGERRLPLSDASRHFTGVALELTPASGLQPEDRRARVGLRQLAGKVSGLERALAQIVAVAFVLELFVVAGPLLNQIVIDDVLASADRDLMTVVVAGFGLLLVVQAALACARSWMVTVLGQALHLQWAGNLFAHLVRLPVDFFEKRDLGDIASRFGSVAAMQRTLAASAIEAMLDGLMAVAALAMMLAYAPLLAAVVVAAVLAYALLRWAGYAPLQAAASERLVLAARENSHFLETLRAMAPLKLFGGEHARRAQWHKLLVDVHVRDVKAARLNIGLATASTLLFGAENLLVLWIGARLAMDVPAGASPFTIGMLFAFLGYKAQFSTRVPGLIDRIVDLRMLGLHAERLGDIALHEPERDGLPANDLAHLPPRIELRNVSFRYGEGEPWLLRHVDAVVEPGDHIAITGASGAGKTTLMKLLLGLLSPTEGEILYGGSPLPRLGLANVRRQFGTVMQDDVLLAGSLADNIAFFDPVPDVARIEACARLAQVHGDIARMPMGYHTLVGDLGCGLSGGQRQQLVLARALYKRPRALLLDEATSHLDVVNERAVVDALAHMQLTRIVIAHRPETIACAQRVLELCDGRLDEPAAAVVDDTPDATVLLQGA